MDSLDDRTSSRPNLQLCLIIGVGHWSLVQGCFLDICTFSTEEHPEYLLQDAPVNLSEVTDLGYRAGLQF
jgi:hypothetical protein